MQSIELNGPLEQAAYVRTIEGRFGKDGVRFLDAVDQWLSAGSPADGAAKLYRQLSRDPAMARIVSSHQYTPLYREVARLLAIWKTPFQADIVVDFGCGFGLLTQLIARLRPDWRVVGTDHREIAQAAKRLVRPPVPLNLTFLDPSSATAVERKRPLVLAICVLHEMLTDSRIDPDPMRENFSQIA